MGTGDPVFITSSLKNGDSVRCTIYSNAACALPSTVSSNSIDIAVNDIKPSILISASDTAICQGEEVRFTAAVSDVSGTAAYKWMVNGSETGSSTPSFVLSTVSNNDYVSCKVSGSAGCAASSSPITITVNSNPMVAFSADYVSYPPQGVLIKPVVTGSIASYSWSPVQELNNPFIASPLATPSINTRYSLTVISTDGCKATASVWVKPSTAVYIPNAFTPNEDGKNDVFYVTGGKDGDTIREFIVFNRWGDKVFQIQNIVPNDPSRGWHGTINGKIAISGTYVYLVKIVSSQGETSTLKGTINLIR
jgi:gliding motility-associated-like protein